MSEILLFHHARGLTPDVLAFAEALARAGHRVHLPDLFEGRTFETLEAGVDHVQELGLEAVMARGEASARDLPHALVYAGVSLGVMPAQKLAMTRPGARGALLISGFVSPEMLGHPWPAGLPVQIHGMHEDPYFAGEGDLDAAEALVGQVPHRELFLYPGSAHLFRGHEEQLLLERALAFLRGRA